MQVNLATTTADGDIETHDIPMLELVQMLVVDTNVCTGFMSFKCDDPDHQDHGHNEAIDEDRDVVTLQVRLLDGSEGTLVFAADTVLSLADQFVGWLNELHEAGQCGCGNHEGEKR